MTFKEFAKSTFNLPATAFRGIVALIMGDYDRYEDGTPKARGVFRGLLGLILDGFKKLLSAGQALGRMITSFIGDHITAIASAFWMSLLIGGAAALTVALWPAALAAVTGFTIAGYSIASIVGAGFAAQVAATAGVAAVLASAAVYTVATVVNIITAIKNCFTKKPGSETKGEHDSEFSPQDEDDFASTRGANPMGRLHTHQGPNASGQGFNFDNNDMPPLQVPSPLSSKGAQGQPLQLDAAPALSMSA